MVQKINPLPAPGCNRSPSYYVCIFKRCKSWECSVHFFRGPCFRSLFLEARYSDCHLSNHFVHFLSCILYKNVPGFETPKFLDCSLYLTLPIDSNTGDFNFIYHSFQIAWFHFRIAGISQIFHFFAAKCEICQFKVFELTR